MPVEPMTFYTDIPVEMRNLLDEFWPPHGVQAWWNCRHGWLDNLRPCEEWKTEEGRERVRAVVHAIATGGWQ